ncbi:alpha/beta fold hydrolase [Embleya sp. NBC_00888]|uniref:thioesterase II family protein n=1 Tax=Embleya sp. NBC_00888 TaxID=2975960 RepID=UPI00386A3D3B|nr:alpha/beta fold hydrolase [Embleya sp. NBC_00888]
MTYSRDDATWIRAFHPGPPAARRLVCFPHAGGAASFYFPLSAVLKPDVQVLAVQYPGREDRFGESVIEDLGLLAEEVAAVLDAAAHPRLVLFGHSMGALLAFEVTRQLERLGRTPARLVVSGMEAPSRRRWADQPGDDRSILDEVRLLHGLSPSALDNDELREIHLPILRGDYRAVDAYRVDPKATVSCPITAFVGDADPLVGVRNVAAWADHTSSSFEISSFPGGHFYLHEFPPRFTAAVALQCESSAR